MLTILLIAIVLVGVGIYGAIERQTEQAKQLDEARAEDAALDRKVAIDSQRMRVIEQATGERVAILEPAACSYCGRLAVMVRLGDARAACLDCLERAAGAWASGHGG